MIGEIGSAVTTASPLWHYPLADHYLRRNPYVAAPVRACAIAAGRDWKPALFPHSQTLERFNNPGRRTDVTSGCGLGIYRDELLGTEFYGNAFVCEPVHNLVHRMVLTARWCDVFSCPRRQDEQDRSFLLRDRQLVSSRASAHRARRRALDRGYVSLCHRTPALDSSNASRNSMCAPATTKAAFIACIEKILHRARLKT